MPNQVFALHRSARAVTKAEWALGIPPVVTKTRIFSLRFLIFRLRALMLEQLNKRPEQPAAPGCLKCCLCPAWYFG